VYNFSSYAQTSSVLADRTDSRAIGTVLRPSSSVVCNVMYCG